MKGVDSGELTNLSKALIETGRIEEALKTLDEVLKKDPANEDTYKNRIVTLHYHPRYSAEEILQECSRMQERFRPTEPVIRARAQDLSPGKKIRIGMFSEGFRAHPVGHMITLALAHVPRHEIEFFFYGTNARSDHITKRLKTICSTWREAQGLSEEALNHLIRADHIDILFDLSGYNAGSRMRTVMLEPAPIIIKWVGGLISNTGLDAVDYLLSDRVETPVDADRLYTEKLIRLPDDYICYEPPDYLPPIKELPAARRGYVTFGCFNNASKINEDLLEHWARILRTVKDSRLFLKSYGFSTGKLRSDIERFFAERGISAHRLTLEGPAPHRELLACYNDIDIALDPWPYSGGLCTCEALIMGVPVVTLPGPTFAGRHSATHLVNAGLPELVAQNWDHYHMLATGLANDLENLSVIRQNLRLTVLKSPLCDAERFGRSFSNAMRAVWQRHCAGKTPEALVLSDDQTPYFADESGPVELILPMPETEVPPCYQRGVEHSIVPRRSAFHPLDGL